VLSLRQKLNFLIKLRRVSSFTGLNIRFIRVGRCIQFGLHTFTIAFILILTLYWPRCPHTEHKNVLQQIITDMKLHMFPAPPHILYHSPIRCTIALTKQPINTPSVLSAASSVTRYRVSLRLHVV